MFGVFVLLGCSMCFWLVDCCGDGIILLIRDYIVWWCIENNVKWNFFFINLFKLFIIKSVVYIKIFLFFFFFEMGVFEVSCLLINFGYNYIK